MKINNLIKKTLLLGISLFPSFLFSAEVAPVDTTAKSFNFLDINVVLLAIAFILLYPLYLYTKSFLLVVKWDYKQGKNSSVANKGMAIALLLFALTNLANAQTAAVTAAPIAASTNNEGNLFTYLVLGIIALEIVVMVYFSNQINKYLSPSVEESVKEIVVKKENWLLQLWAKANNLKPIEEEGSIDTGHSYDGIRELDNITPPWFKFGFLLSIIFAIAYLYVYHVSHSAPSQIEEYNAEMEKAEIDKSNLLATQGSAVDENTVVMLAGADLLKGKEAFGAFCSSCHGPNGASMKGGVGPNLTDDYWIHGGDLKSIFKSIKYGWKEKGMIAWENQFSPTQIAQITSYIKSIKGTNPPGGKEPQGDLFTESGMGSAENSIADSTKQ